jgi:hypothetical protein
LKIEKCKLLLTTQPLAHYWLPATGYWLDTNVVLS